MQHKFNADRRDKIPKQRYRAMDLPRFCAAPRACLGHFSFESDRAFPAEC